jgi:mono/diheme cytochrome c family protein
MASLSLFGALLVTAAFAAPPKDKGKKPPKKDDKAAVIAKGKKVYDANGCANCHAIKGKGGSTGPDLTKVAAEPKHDAKWLKEKVINPKASDPDSTMPAYEDTIKGKDLDALVAYLSSLK